MIVYCKESILFIDASSLEVIYKHTCSFSVLANNKDEKLNLKMFDDDSIIISDEKCLFKLIKFYNEYNILGIKI